MVHITSVFQIYWDFLDGEKYDLFFKLFCGSWNLQPTPTVAMPPGAGEKNKMWTGSDLDTERQRTVFFSVPTIGQALC